MLAVLAGGPAMVEWSLKAEDGSQEDARFYGWTHAVSETGTLFVSKFETEKNTEIYVAIDTALCDTNGALLVDVAADGRRIAIVRYMDLSIDGKSFSNSTSVARQGSIELRALHWMAPHASTLKLSLAYIPDSGSAVWLMSLSSSTRYVRFF